MYFERWLNILKRNGINVAYKAVALDSNTYDCTLEAKSGVLSFTLRRKATTVNHTEITHLMMGELLKHGSFSLPTTQS